MSKVVVLQPSFIPWRGYFHQIQKSDTFVFYDDVQYDKNGWRNRNRIKTTNGVRWLTVPVHGKGAVLEATPLKSISISWEKDWRKPVWETVRQSYSKAPYFSRYAEVLQPFFTERTESLVDLTIGLTKALANELGIGGRTFMRSSELNVSGERMEHLLNVLKAVGATHYVSGPSAQSYIDEGLFAQNGITLEYMTYDYPEYEQLYPPYDPQVSVIDLLFMKGPEAPRYIWDGGQ